MPLADDTVRVTVAGEALTLRASLRAATRLCRHYEGDFNVILRGIRNGELGVIAKVIEETSTSRTTVPELLFGLTGWPLSEVLAELMPAAEQIVRQLASVDDEPKDDVKPDAAGPRMTVDQFHTELFKIATGWLGWTPDQAWNATPAEILAGHRGRIDMLKAIFGGTSDEEPAAPVIPDSSPDPDARLKLRNMMAAGLNRGR